MIRHIISKRARLYTGNNLHVLEQFKPNYFQLTVTSPPYDTLRDYSKEGFHLDVEAISKSLFRVTKAGGVVVWNVGDQTIKGSESGTSFRQALTFIENGWNLHDTMIWEKPNFSMPSSNRYHQIFEYMFVFSKGKPSTFNGIEDKPIFHGKPVGKNTLRGKNGEMIEMQERHSNGKAFGKRNNIWKINTSGQEDMCKKQWHPATFSRALARDHILSWSNPNDCVLDPFSGRGTTVAEALKLNRRGIGIEISGEYSNQSLDWIKRETRDTNFLHF
jgi:DNA modification methylase